MQQLGFDMVYTDPTTKEIVPWALPIPSLLAEIEQASWKIVDTETTGLNPASIPQKFSAKELRTGVNATLRMRVASVLYEVDGIVKVVSFDFDQLTSIEKSQVADAIWNKYVFAHNGGFDAYWIGLHSKNRPTKLLDSMLIARIMAPEHVVNMARLSSDESADPDMQQQAYLMFMGGKSGWSLADLSVGILGKVVPKNMQGPKNWCQPFLTQEAYQYATDDVRLVHELLIKFFNVKKGTSLIDAYEAATITHPTLKIIEPQVMDVVDMRRRGMPWSAENAQSFIASQRAKVADLVDKLIDFEPSLARFKLDIGDFNKGVGAELKKAIGQAFMSRGVDLDMTEKSGTFKIGEKDLRKVKAQTSSEAGYLFDLWTSINRAKKSSNMAIDFTGYAQRSPDGMLHPNTSHGPITGRLSSSEPNCQQMPRDQGFRNGVKARPNHKIIASDYSALDMRVGAALAIRAQEQIVEAYMRDRPIPMDVYTCISRVIEGRISMESAVAMSDSSTEQFSAWKAKREDATDLKAYWNEYRRLARQALLAKFQKVLLVVRTNAKAEGTATWGSLRNAFKINGMDIHTWTALSMIGKNPDELFKGLSDEEVASLLKANKKELGDKRQTGKVGNLSLLYAMKTFGLVEAAAKNYNIHWEFEEADKVREDWLKSYPEIDLWHMWTELNPACSVYVPDPDRGGKVTKKDVFASYTLGGRLIYAFGLNAALSYEDQSTGADILGRVMHTLRVDYPDIFECVINQVHDEMVFEVPDEKSDEYSEIISRVMTECAEHFLMKYGVKGECSPAIGDVWLKD